LRQSAVMGNKFGDSLCQFLVAIYGSQELSRHQFSPDFFKEVFDIEFDQNCAPQMWDCVRPGVPSLDESIGAFMDAGWMVSSHKLSNLFLQCF